MKKPKTKIFDYLSVFNKSYNDDIYDLHEQVDGLAGASLAQKNFLKSLEKNKRNANIDVQVEEKILDPKIRMKSKIWQAIKNFIIKHVSPLYSMLMAFIIFSATLVCLMSCVG